MAHLFPAHFGQFVQINVDAVEPDPIGRPTLRMQDLLHQHVEEELDAAEETTRAGAWAQRRPPPPRRGRGTRCALWPAPWVQLSCSATGPLGGRTLLVIALSRAGGKSHLPTDCKAWRAHYHTAGFKATNRQPKQYQPFFPAVPLQDFKALPQDQTDQLKTDNLCYKGREDRSA